MNGKKEHSILKTMKINFKYNREKDIWCLLNKGKSSNNSSNPTLIYQELVAKTGESPDELPTSTFIDEYLNKNNIKPDSFIKDYQREYNSVSANFQTISKKVFGVSLNKEITAYLTTNTRCPYNIKESWFFVSMTKANPLLTIMHELWHFYTWKKFGAEWEAQIGKGKYNAIKEALTVLLNIECRSLLPAGAEDKGYPQHQELRNKIIELWNQNPNIDYLWKEILVLVE